MHEAVLAKVDLDVLRESIDLAESLIESSSDEASILRAIDAVLLCETSGSARKGIIPLTMIKLQHGNRIYRVRPIDDPKPEYDVSEFWAPPVRFVSNAGRMNSVGESILYCSDDTLAALDEVGVKADGAFLLIVYKAKRPIDCIGLGPAPESDDSTTQEKMNLIHGFLERAFYSVGSRAYLISNYLAKKYFNININSYSYKSVKKSSATNFCFQSGAVDNLELHKVLLGYRRAGFQIPGRFEPSTGANYRYAHYESEAAYKADEVTCFSGTLEGPVVGFDNNEPGVLIKIVPPFEK